LKKISFQSFEGGEPLADLSETVGELAEKQAQTEPNKKSTLTKIMNWFGISTQYTGIASALLGFILYVVNTGLVVASGTGLSIILGPLMIGMLFGGLALIATGLIATKGKTKGELREEGGL